MARRDVNAEAGYFALIFATQNMLQMHSHGIDVPTMLIRHRRL
jgi:hypothetical protein